MIDHVSLPVSDIERSIAFYTAALAPLGHELSTRFELPEEGLVLAAFGPAGGAPAFWLGGPASPGGAVTLPLGTHFAFTAADRDAVDAFHSAGLNAGGSCNGPPGERPHYHPGYYAAFLKDPDGHHVEAVHHG